MGGGISDTLEWKTNRDSRSWGFLEHRFLVSRFKPRNKNLLWLDGSSLSNLAVSVLKPEFNISWVESGINNRNFHFVILCLLNQWFSTNYWTASGVDSSECWRSRASNPVQRQSKRKHKSTILSLINAPCPCKQFLISMAHFCLAARFWEGELQNSTQRAIFY